jgi:hypothetical protein
MIVSIATQKIEEQEKQAQASLCPPEQQCYDRRCLHEIRLMRDVGKVMFAEHASTLMLRLRRHKMLLNAQR